MFLGMSFFMKIASLSLIKINLIQLLSYLYLLLHLIVSTNHTIDESSVTNSNPSTSQQITQTPRRSLRQVHKPSKFKDIHISYSPSTAASCSIGTCLYPISFILSYSRLSSSYHNAIMSVTQHVEP